MLEEAIKMDSNIKYDDYEILVGNKDSDRLICERLINRIPRIKIVKLHGQITSFSSLLGKKETNSFPKILENEIKRLFINRDIVMISDYYIDNDILNCISKNERTIIFVHPNFNQKCYDKHFIPAYQHYKVLEGIDAEFDRFFIKLNEILS